MAMWEEGLTYHVRMYDAHELLLLEMDGARVAQMWQQRGGQTELEHGVNTQCSVCICECVWVCVCVFVCVCVWVCVHVYTLTSKSSRERAMLRRLERLKERRAAERCGRGGKPIVRPRNRLPWGDKDTHMFNEHSEWSTTRAAATHQTRKLVMIKTTSSRWERLRGKWSVSPPSAAPAELSIRCFIVKSAEMTGWLGNSPLWDCRSEWLWINSKQWSFDL